VRRGRPQGTGNRFYVTVYDPAKDSMLQWLRESIVDEREMVDEIVAQYSRQGVVWAERVSSGRPWCKRTGGVDVDWPDPRCFDGLAEKERQRKERHEEQMRHPWEQRYPWGQYYLDALRPT